MIRFETHSGFHEHIDGSPVRNSVWVNPAHVVRVIPSAPIQGQPQTLITLTNVDVNVLGDAESVVGRLMWNDEDAD